MSKVKYFIDTEFIERPGLLDLISIGIACEDGREYYAVSADFNVAEASYWVRANVLPRLPPRKTWKPRETIAAEILAFVTGEPAFWAYYADYDWVLFCWLFGAMIDLPSRWPMFCLDLKQSMVERGVDRGELPKQDPATEHDALADARWVRKAHGVVYATEDTCAAPVAPTSPAECWAIAGEEHAEQWDGHAQTRETAIEMWRSLHGSEEFWIARARALDPKFYAPKAAYVIEAVRDVAAGDAGFGDGDPWPEVSDAGRAALDALLATWAAEHLTGDRWVTDEETTWERVEGTTGENGNE